LSEPSLKALGRRRERPEARRSAGRRDPGMRRRLEQTEPSNPPLNHAEAARPTRHTPRWWRRPRPWCKAKRRRAGSVFARIPVTSDEQESHWNFSAETRAMPLLNAARRPIYSELPHDKVARSRPQSEPVLHSGTVRALGSESNDWFMLGGRVRRFRMFSQ
jgi:hypothetical protein